MESNSPQNGTAVLKGRIFSEEPHKKLLDNRSVQLYRTYYSIRRAGPLLYFLSSPHVSALELANFHADRREVGMLNPLCNKNGRTRRGGEGTTPAWRRRRKPPSLKYYLGFVDQEGREGYSRVRAVYILAQLGQNDCKLLDSKT